MHKGCVVFYCVFCAACFNFAGSWSDIEYDETPKKSVQPQPVLDATGWLEALKPWDMRRSRRIGDIVCNGVRALCRQALLATIAQDVQGIRIAILAPPMWYQTRDDQCIKFQHHHGGSAQIESG
jgi:hypothetical protein